jgi:ADP-heptose:LPS heptosyltransferase
MPPASKTVPPAARIAIILPRQLGDVILGTTLVSSLKAHYPDCRIVWVAHPMATAVLEGNPGIEKVVYLPQGKRAFKSKSKGLLGSLQKTFGQTQAELATVAELRAFQPQIVIDAINNPRTSILAALSGAPWRISFRTRFSRNICFNELIPRELLAGDYMGRSRLALLAPLGISDAKAPTVPPLHIPRTAADKQTIDQLVAQQFGNSPFKAINIFVPSRRETRCWPVENYLELARHLVFKRGLQIIWFWGPGEDAIVRPLHDKLVEELKSRGLNPAQSWFPPLLSIRESAELSARSLCWVGSTSGLAHVAVAAHCKTVELHGPTTPKPWTHPDTTRHRPVTKGSGCMACERNVCRMPRRECMEDISVACVIQNIESLIDNERNL